MADVENEAGQEDGDQTSSKKTFPDRIIKLLMILVGFVLLIGFVITVTYFTVSVMEKGTRESIILSGSTEFESVPEQLTYFSLIPEIRTSTNDPDPSTVVVNLRLGFQTNDSALELELTAVYPRLTDMIRAFFSSKSKEEMKPQNERRLKEELLLRVNQLLVGQVKEVLFLDFQVIGI